MVTQSNDSPEKQYNTCGELFYEELFPFAINIGMSPQEFWDDDPMLFLSYRKAFETSEERKTREIDTLAWLVGSYNMQAFSIVLSQAFSKHKVQNKYPKQPNTFNTLPNAKQQEEAELLQQYSGFKALADAMNRKFNHETV